MQVRIARQLLCCTALAGLVFGRSLTGFILGSLDKWLECRKKINRYKTSLPLI